jgi:hypothetical protein
MMFILNAELMFLMAYLEWGIVEVSSGRQTGLNALFLPIVLIGIIGTVGSHIYLGYKAH